MNYWVFEWKKRSDHIYMLEEPNNQGFSRNDEKLNIKTMAYNAAPVEVQYFFLFLALIGD